ncbi:MAG TPA: DNA mismatch repair endonuclease MutL [Ignavibacteria bacterium]|jgi:DNA mismatch repair protein MutL
MMIKILPQYIANRIAAGEVVGRPEAVVKELIENSLDAGAEKTEVIIRDAGKSLVQVIDDGLGMSEDDAMMSFQRHATSKISEAEDLECIRTFGFRGEALASIAAVAQVEMKTRQEEDELGTFIKNNGNEIVEHSKIQCEKGTSVSVKNLFYNTPARRNFLKSDQTEFKHIYDTFIREAIANYDVSFVLINGDVEVLNLYKTDLQNRLIQIYGLQTVENLLEVSYSNDIISLKGFIAKPSFTKKTKQEQMLFLNKRYVVSRSLSFAVHHAYEDLVDKGDYPNFFLFLELNPMRFDVNVHPSKLEVKFDDEKALFSFIRKGVWSTLEKNDLVFNVKTDEVFHEPAITPNILSSGSFVPKTDRDSTLSFKKNISSPSQSFRDNIHEMFNEFKGVESKISEVINIKSTSPAQPVSDDTESSISKSELWQFQKKYIMYQLESTLMIIDQHAAHERVLYEQAIDRLNSNANLSQQLLFPIYSELSPVDHEIVRSLETEFTALGFDLEIQSKRKVKIKGIPSDVRIGDEGKILQELIDQYKEYDVKLNLEKRDNLAKSYACKHAIKAGDFLNENEMLNLIDKLFSSQMPYVCPHGRPTIVRLTMDELDKMFYRVM